MSTSNHLSQFEKCNFKSWLEEKRFWTVETELNNELEAHKSKTICDNDLKIRYVIFKGKT